MTMGWAAKTPEERQIHADLGDLMTPVVKAFFTDGGFEAANDCMQVWGGHGYVRDNGMEQFVRDARSTRSTRARTACRPSTWWAASWARRAGARS